MIDMEAVRTIRSADQSGKLKFTPYDGRQVKGWPRHTIVRGQIVVQDGVLTGAPRGVWIRPEEGI